MIGQQIGHYRLEEKLGRGGFGTVYAAAHMQLPSLRVAIKVAHENLAADASFQRLLQKEVEVLHRLQHPGIVAFRDLVVEPAHTAIVMELLQGRDLRHALAEGPFRPEEVARLLHEVLEALAVAHGQEIVHRDLKPENIFLCADGRLKLMDFGIAKVAHTTLASQSGMVSGTLDYMAPERFRQRSPAASDLYALGLVAWELLTGRMACPEGDIPAKIGWHMGRGAPDVRDEAPSCPAWLARFVAGLTAVEAEDRPVDAQEALALLGEGWPHPGQRGSKPVMRAGTGQVPRAASTPPVAADGRSGPTLAPGLAPLVDVPLVQKSTPTWAPPREVRPSGPPASGPTAAPTPAPSPPPTLWQSLAPRGFGMVMDAVGLALGTAATALAFAMGGTGEPEEAVGTVMGVLAILAAPVTGTFFFIAGVFDGRALGRALQFGLASLAATVVLTSMPIAMLVDGEEASTAAAGGICCGGLPLVFIGVLAAVFLWRGLAQHRRRWQTWRGEI